MKKLAITASAAALVVALAGCGGSGSGAADGDISVGIIAPASGAFGEIGQNIRDGVQIAFDQVNADGGVAGGKKLAMVAKDEGDGPETATQAARDLISDDVTLLGGLFTSADCGAVSPVLEQSPAVLVTASCASNELTGAYSGKAPFQRSFGVAVRDKSNAAAIGKVVARAYPKVTNYSVFGFDYNWGRDTWSDFKDTLVDQGIDVDVDGEQWVPLSTSDYRSQVSSINRGLGGDKASRGIFLSTFGAGTSGFLQQAKALDLAGNVAVLANSGEYYNVARSLDGQAPEVWNSYDYNWAAFDSALNKSFVDAYGKKRNGAKPVGWTYQGYLVGLAYAAAIDKAGGADAEKVRKALEGLKFEGPSGELTMGADSHQLSAPAVTSRTVGSSDEPDGVKVLDTTVVPYDGK